MASPRDRFYQYLDYCDKHGPIGPGDYIELINDASVLAWTRLVTDLRDTHRAGILVKTWTENGSIAYIRPK